MTDFRSYTLDGCATEGVRVYVAGSLAGGFRRTLAPADDLFAVFTAGGHLVGHVDDEFLAVDLVGGVYRDGHALCAIAEILTRPRSSSSCRQPAHDKQTAIPFQAENAEITEIDPGTHST